MSTLNKKLTPSHNSVVLEQCPHPNCPVWSDPSKIQYPTLNANYPPFDPPNRRSPERRKPSLERQNMPRTNNINLTPYCCRSPKGPHTTTPAWTGQLAGNYCVDGRAEARAPSPNCSGVVHCMRAQVRRAVQPQQPCPPRSPLRARARRPTL